MLVLPARGRHHAAVVTSLLETKLQPPHVRPSTVDRVRLLDRLGRDGVPRLILVSAPPGFGKTTLVAQWIGEQRVRASVAWVSLDPADADPVRFWTYVATALERAVPGTGRAALEHLFEGQGRVDLATSALASDLAVVDLDLILVLDDLHVVESREVADGLAFLLDHLPPQVHLVILTRADPPLPIARLRARGELVEVRAADLRFTPEEAAAYLNDRMGLGLGSADVGTLEARTEGWIAALQLAAISMRGRDDAASFVASFAGDDRYVVDYLADEVLDRQTAEVREFLLSTSILEQLTGPLCDAVTGGVGGTATLEALERANLFLIPLDDRRRWYRYHHLFGDLLRARLLHQRPGEAAVLHARASQWWEANDRPQEAIGHALAAADFERAADLIEVTAHDLRKSRQEATLRRWLDALPEEVFECRPVLAIAHAGALLSTGEARGADGRLAAAERWIPASTGPGARAAAEAEGMVVRHPTALSHLPGAIALYRAALAKMQGDIEETMRQAEAALEAAHRDQPLERGAAAGMLALARWTAGDLQAAHDTWSRAIVDLDRAGHEADMLGGFLAMADIRIAQGRLADARLMYERGLHLGTQRPVPLRGTADMHVGLAELDLERNDLAAAISRLQASAALGDMAGLPQNPWRWRSAMAGVRAAGGDFEAAHQLLDEAERVYAADFFPAVRPIAAFRARLWTRQGRRADALAWAALRHLSTDDPVTYITEYEHVTLVQALLAGTLEGGARGDLDAAAALIDRMLVEATGGGRLRSVIELSAMHAIVRAAMADGDGAALSIREALSLAEPEGFVRLFLDLGPALVPLLRDTAARSAAPRYARTLLTAIEGGEARSAPAASLVEPLSNRELDVLRLLASDLDGPAIASQLFVSLNTMRTHTKNIFAKLGVNSRRAAVARAAELGLVSRGR